MAISDKRLFGVKEMILGTVTQNAHLKMKCTRRTASLLYIYKKDKEIKVTKRKSSLWVSISSMFI